MSAAWRPAWRGSDGWREWGSEGTKTARLRAGPMESGSGTCAGEAWKRRESARICAGGWRRADVLQTSDRRREFRFRLRLFVFPLLIEANCQSEEIFICARAFLSRVNAQSVAVDQIHQLAQFRAKSCHVLRRDSGAWRARHGTVARSRAHSCGLRPAWPPRVMLSGQTLRGHGPMRLVDPRHLPQLMPLEDHEATVVEATAEPRNSTPTGAGGGPGQQQHPFPWVVTVLAGVLITTIVVDVIGNLLVIVSVFRNRKLRKAGVTGLSVWSGLKFLVVWNKFPCVRTF